MRIETIQISSDAYYYLHCGEEPIDPDNIDEADELKQTFSPGFRFVSKPEPIQGTDMVEVQISVAEEHKIEGHFIVRFIVMPYRNVEVRVYDSRSGYMEKHDVEKLEAIGDAYWAEYRYYAISRTRNSLQVCKIAEYEKWFGKS